MTRIIATDWSGAKKYAAKKIWRAEASRPGDIDVLTNGLDRDAITRYLIEQAAIDKHVVVGLDFAFSMPAGFLHQRGIDSAPTLWSRMAAGECEEWLGRGESPFWGRKGSKKPLDVELFRRDEIGTGAKSVFQIGGAGAVGTGSLRGMAVLHQLRAAGFSIWPFDPPGWPLVVEIYPAAFYKRRVIKTRQDCRENYLGTHCQLLSPAIRELAASGEDAFDAAVSALSMIDHIDEMESLPEPHDDVLRLEGMIWRPRRDVTSTDAS